MPNPTDTLNKLVSEVTLTELCALLIKDKQLHEGLYNVVVKFQIALGAVGPTQETTFPGAMLSVSGVGLEKVTHAGHLTVDAASVNPAIGKVSLKSLVGGTRKRGGTPTT